MPKKQDEDLIGHNSGRLDKEKTAKLKSFVKTIQALEQEKKDAADSIKDTYASAKEYGFDTKALRTLIKEMKTDKEEAEQFENVLDLYRMALGLI